MKFSHPEVLFSKSEVDQRVQELGARIVTDFNGEYLNIIGISNGAIPFVADLIRQIPLPMQLDIIGVKSYRGTKSSGKIKLTSELTTNINNCYVILVDDILDTGRTLKNVSEYLESFEPAKLKTCVFLNKPARREVPFAADYVGFEVPNKFVVGYGLDYNGFFRNLDYVGILPEDHLQ